MRALLSDGQLLPGCGSLVDSIVSDDSYHYMDKLKTMMNAQGVVIVNGFRYVK